MATSQGHTYQQRLARALRAVILWLGIGYGAMLVVLTVLWTFWPSASSLVRLSNIFAAWLFAPLLLLIPLALLLRSWGLTLAALIPATVFALSMWPWGPSAKPVAAGGTQLRVATVNLFFENTNYAGMIEAIQREQADVIGLQELAPGAAEALSQALQSSYPYQLLAPQNGPNGLGILSRVPFRETQPHNFRGQWIEILYEDQPISLINVHLSAPRVVVENSANLVTKVLSVEYDTSYRDEQTQQLLEYIDATSGAMIVFGDFNTSDREAGYRLFAQRLQDTYRATNGGFGFTFPNRKTFAGITVPVPLVRIDYVWSRALRPATSHVTCAPGGIDHCMLVTDMRVAS